jgi:hypothetical protein
VEVAAAAEKDPSAAPQAFPPARTQPHRHRPAAPPRTRRRPHTARSRSAVPSGCPRATRRRYTHTQPCKHSKASSVFARVASQKYATQRTFLRPRLSPAPPPPPPAARVARLLAPRAARPLLRAAPGTAPQRRLRPDTPWTSRTSIWSRARGQPPRGQPTRSGCAAPARTAPRTARNLRAHA